MRRSVWLATILAVLLMLVLFRLCGERQDAEGTMDVEVPFLLDWMGSGHADARQRPLSIGMKTIRPKSCRTAPSATVKAVISTSWA